MSRNRILSWDGGVAVSHLKFMDMWIDDKGRVIYPHLFWQLARMPDGPLTFVVRYD